MRLLPNLLAALSGYAFTVFAVGVLSALQNATAQGWSDLGFDWLTLDAWSRLHESKEGVGGGVLTLVLACTADLLPPAFLPALWVRKAVNLFSIHSFARQLVQKRFGRYQLQLKPSKDRSATMAVASQA